MLSVAWLHSVVKEIGDTSKELGKKARIVPVLVIGFVVFPAINKERNPFAKAGVMQDSFCQSCGHRLFCQGLKLLEVVLKTH